MERPAVTAASSIEASVGPARPERFAALRVRTFRWYWILGWISSTGDGMENVIRAFLVVDLVGLSSAPFWLGMMLFAHWVPFTLFSLYGGALADRYDNRKVQILAQVLLLTAAIGTAVTTLTGIVTVWWLFGLLLLHGFAGAIGGPAQQTLIHSMVGRDRVLSAVALNSIGRQFSPVVGPAVAGLVFLAFGAGWGFAVNALTFLPLLLFLLVVRVPVLHRSERRAITGALREALSFIRERPVTLSLIVIEAGIVMFIGQAFTSLLVVLSAERFPSLAFAYPSLLVASGAGAMLAAVWLAYAGQHRRAGRMVLAAAVAQMTAVFIIANATDYVASLAVMVVYGASALVTHTLVNTLLQLSAPDRMRGRVMGAYAFGTAGMRVVNGPLIGGLAATVGVAATMAGASAAVGLIGLACGPAVPRLGSEP